MAGHKGRQPDTYLLQGQVSLSFHRLQAQADMIYHSIAFVNSQTTPTKSGVTIQNSAAIYGCAGSLFLTWAVELWSLVQDCATARSVTSEN